MMRDIKFVTHPKKNIWAMGDIVSRNQEAADKRQQALTQAIQSDASPEKIRQLSRQAIQQEQHTISLQNIRNTMIPF